MNATATQETSVRVNALRIGYATSIRGIMVWRVSEDACAVGATIKVGAIGVSADERLLRRTEVVNEIIRIESW